MTRGQPDEHATRHLPVGLPSLESHNEKMRDEYETGVDKTGPRWEDGDDEDAIDAAGRTAYYEEDGEETP